MPDDIQVRRRKLTEYKSPAVNPNSHRERGLQAIEDSIRYNGAGRSGLVTADDVITAGDGTREAMLNAGIEDVLEVTVKGDTWVVVKREDLFAGDPKEVSLKIADNRAHTLDYNENVQAVGQLLAELVDTPELVKAAGYEAHEVDEVGALLDDLFALDENIEPVGVEPVNKGRVSQIIRCLIASPDVQLFEQAIQLTGRLSRHEALGEICRTYVEGREGVGREFVLFPPIEQVPKIGGAYILQDVEMTGLCKIGATTNLVERFKRARSGYPFEVRLVWYTASDNHYQTETALHEQFDSKRVKAEWFALDAEDLRLIRETFGAS